MELKDHTNNLQIRLEYENLHKSSAPRIPYAARLNYKTFSKVLVDENFFDSCLGGCYQEFEKIPPNI